MRTIKLIDLILSFVITFVATNAQEQIPELVIRTGHPNGVVQIAFSPNGKTIATGDADGQSVKLWDASSGILLISLPTSSKNIRFNADGKLLITNGYGNLVDFWNVETGSKINSILLPEFSDCVSTNLNDDGTLLIANCGFNVRVWETTTGKNLYDFKLDNFDSFSEVAISPDGNLIARGNILIHLKTGKISRLDIPQKKQNDSSSRLLGSGGSFSSRFLIFSHDSKKLAVADGQRLLLYDTTSEKVLYQLGGHKDIVSSIAFSSNAQYLVSGSRDKIIKLWNVETGAELPQIINPQNSEITSLAFSEDGEKLASGSKESIVRLWDFQSGKELGTLGIFSAGIQAVVCSPKQKTLASLESGGRIKIWTLESEKEPFVLGIASTSEDFLLFNNDGNSIISLTRPEAYFWNAENGKLINKLPFLFDEPFAISPNGKMYASGQNFSDTSVVDYGTVDLLNEFRKESIDWKKFEPLMKRFKMDAYILEIIFSENSDFLIIKARNYNGPINVLGTPTIGDSTITIRKIDDNTVVGSFKGNILNFALSLDGEFLAVTETIGNIEDFSSPTKVSIWDIKKQTLSKQFDNNLRQNGALQFSPKGDILAGVFVNNTGTFANTIKLWNVKTGAEISKISEKLGNINSISFTSDGNFLIGIGADTSIKVWDVKTGKELCSLFSFNNSDWLVTTPDGLFDGSPKTWKQLVWRFEKTDFNYAPVEAFFKEFYYPGLLQEIMAGKDPKPPQKDLSQVDIRQPGLKISEIDGKLTDSNTETSANKPTVKVKVEIADNANKGRKDSFPASSGAQDLRLFRNGSLVKLWEKNVFELTEKDGCKQIAATKDSPRKAICETEVQITADKNELTAYTFNHDNVKSNDATAEIKGAESLKRKGKIQILAIGVNEYQNKDYNLKFAVPDAVDFGAELRKNQLNLNNYETPEVVQLTDKDATKQNILDALERFAKGEKALKPASLSAETEKKFAAIQKTQPEDVLVIYFAGHGTASKDRFYLIPTDGFPTSSETEESRIAALQRQSISDLELEAVLRDLDAGQLMLIVDACNSGQALEAEEKRRGPMNSRGLAQLAFEKGMYILTAAQSYQAALEVSRTPEGKKIEHGLLTFSLLDGLVNQKTDADSDKNITEREWFSFAVGEVPRMQLEEMQRRSAEIKRGDGIAQGRSDIFFVGGDKEKDAEKRGLQTPRVFYRRESSANPFIVAKP